MGSFKHPRVFDPLDLQIIELVYEAAWTELAARSPLRDQAKDEERQEALSKLVFAVAQPGSIEFDNLLDNVLATPPEMLEPWSVVATPGEPIAKSPEPELAKTS